MHLTAVDVVVVVDSVISDQWCRSHVCVERRSTVRRVFDVFLLASLVMRRTVLHFINRLNDNSSDLV